MTEPQILKTSFRRSMGLFSSGENSAVQKAKIVDMGGAGDCGFRSVAAGLINNLLIGGRLDNASLQSILTQHFQYFPTHRLNAKALSTSREKFEFMLNHIPLGELIPALAFTLRQMAVDRMVKQPEIYRGAFCNHSKNTAPEMMRQIGTFIDENAIAALSEVLSVPINVRVIESGKEIAAKLTYNRQNPNSSIDIQLNTKRQHWVPYVAHSKLTHGIQARAIPPVLKKGFDDPSLEKVLEKITEDDKVVLEKYEDYQRCLEYMVLSDEVVKSDLMNAYIEGMATSDYLQGRVKYIGVEHGNQNFFDLLLSAREKVVVPQNSKYDEQVTQALIQAIARAISIGQMSIETLNSLGSKSKARIGLA
jgi:hypothetical protein